MILTALPGKVGDGGAVTVPATGIKTYQGKLPTTDTLKRFLVGPVGGGITGVCESTDSKTLFINIQHPGETTAIANIGDPTKYTPLARQRGLRRRRQQRPATLGDDRHHQERRRPRR